MRRALLPPRRLAPRPAGRPTVVHATQLSPGDAADAAYGWTPTATHTHTPAAQRPPQPSPTAVRRPRTPTGGVVRELPVASIRRPLGKSRSNDADKVAALMASIAEHGLREPIDVLTVRVGDGDDDAAFAFYGFSGCHRFEAHQKLGRETIMCRVRVVSAATLRMHLA